MNKEKFDIPMPDRQSITDEIQQIVTAGVRKKESFPAYLYKLQKQIGMKNLLPSRLEEIGILLTVIVILLILSGSMKGEVGNQDLYAFIFLLSPLLYLSLSVYYFALRRSTGTYEVEMICKYNLYQISAFRMLALSVISIAVNSISIFLLAMSHSELSFLRALLISIASLFLFSVFFLFILMKKQSLMAVVFVTGSWVVVNAGFKVIQSELYLGLLMKAPLFVYVIVFTVSFLVYINYLSKLVYFRSSEEGAH
ncbi:hypothetical protein CEF21_03360 [Bacillus sp. FJAT-42376]|uniref:hypothetical protein n=1 Tax=Bacillus sp. FJAT-42376 TaxID=2014076 RepID=UPI000F4D68E4|nr:hypothetical protein [Bacillus sp. FJAT-42376]AZB41415.1 hypothetical protein CEF21_03360 [Bacillus sp. FJAT-42376]